MTSAAGISMPRVALGFALSPLASGVLQAALMGNAGALVVVVFSYPCALLLGIPAFVAARRLGWLSLWAVIVTGAALGLFAGIVINYLAGAGFGDYSAWSMILGLLLFAAHGAAVAGLFWLIALWRWHDDRRDSAS